MYNDTIKVANKIISDRDLLDIFQKMDEDLRKNRQQYEQEKILNEKYTTEYQKWTVRFFDGSFRCTFDFYDDTNITVDNFNSFLTIFNNRLQEVKYMDVNFHNSYTIQDGKESKSVSNRIYLTIREDKMSIEVGISSEDEKMNDIYETIKQKVLSAPERYDRVIRRKTYIINKVGFALGIIPSLVICTLLAIVPEIRQIYGMTFVLYPVVVCLFAFGIGCTLFVGHLDRLYSTIVPNKKYAYYDTTNYKSVYKDDIEDYVAKSEIIIGKNINNIRNREEIQSIEAKYSKFIPIELIVLGVLSIIMIIVGRFIE